MIRTDVIGNLGADVVQNTVSNKTVLNFSLAHTESYKDAQGVKREKVLWIKCAWWTDRTGIAPYLKKGVQVYVTGQPEVSVYTDKSGRTQAEFKLRVSQIQLLGGKKGDNGSNSPQNANAGYSNSSSNTDYDDLNDPNNAPPF